MNNLTAGIYVRVSTSAQSTDMQEDELIQYVSQRGWKHRMYRDEGQSGAKEKRPALTQLLDDCRKRRVDVVVVWSMDRLARSLRNLLTIVEELQKLGVEFVCYKQQIDTSTAAGRLAYQVLGAVAEFEREMLRERVKAGIAHAKKNGRRVGRPPLKHFTSDERVEIKTAHAKGQSIRELATQLGTTQWTVARILAAR